MIAATHVAALAAGTLLLAACAGEGDGGAATDAGGDRVPVTVATTFYPFAWLAGEIAPDADTHLLAGDAAADPHDLQLSPREMSTLLGADVVVHIGDIGYQPDVQRALQDAEGTVVAGIEHVDPFPLPPYPHDDGHEHEHGTGDADGVDPHVWQSPSAMASIARAVADAIAAVDPAGRDDYLANADRISGELEALAEETADAFRSCDHDRAVLSHAGYTYLLTPHGIRQEPLTGPQGHGEPSPARLAEVARRVRDQDLPAILTEPAEGRRAAESVSRETDRPLLEVHPLGSVTPEQAQRGYPELLRENVAAFASALGCAGAEAPRAG